MSDGSSGGPSDKKSMSSRVLEPVPDALAAFGNMGGGPKAISSSTSITSSKSSDSLFLAGPRGPLRLRLGIPFDMSGSPSRRDDPELLYDDGIEIPFAEALRRSAGFVVGGALLSDPRRAGFTRMPTSPGVAIL